MTRALAAVALLVACGEPPAPPPDIAPEPPPPAPEPAPPAPPPAPAPAASVRAWRWYHAPPARDTGGLGDGALHDHAALHVVGAPRRFLIARDGGALVVRREDRTALDPPVDPAWVRRYDVGAAGDPVIGTELGGALHAAAPTARGYVVLALDPDDGAVRWTAAHDGDGAGPIQLGLGGGAEPIVAYVRAASGAYLHELDPATGAIGAVARFGPEVHRDAFTPTGARALAIGRPTQDGLRLVRAGRGGLAVRGGPLGYVELTDSDPFADRAAFAVLDDTVVVVTFCSGASGATAYGIDRRTGARAWATSPGSIGPIGHSRYGNDVRVAVEGERVVVHGDESAGRYVGVLDPRLGRLLGYEVFRR